MEDVNSDSSEILPFIVQNASVIDIEHNLDSNEIEIRVCLMK